MPTQTDPHATTTQLAACEAQPREELCGEHIGDRRVRVPRQQRVSVTKKITSFVRRALSR